MKTATSLFYCQFCNDRKRIQSKLYEAQCILNSLQRYGFRPAQIDDRLLWASITMDNTNSHSRCGNCSDIDKQSLKNVEAKICELIYAVCLNIRNGSDVHAYEVQRLLAGRYPTKYKAIEKEIFLSKLSIC